MVELEKKMSQKPQEQVTKGTDPAGRQDAVPEKFVLPELGYWGKLNIKLRSKVHDDITYHHAWWVIHAIVTGILLWLYFAHHLNFPAGNIAIFELLIGVAFRNEIIITLLHYTFALAPFGKRFFQSYVALCRWYTYFSSCSRSNLAINLIDQRIT